MSTTIPINPVPLPTGDALTQPRKLFRGSTLQEVITFLRSQASQGYLTQTWQRYFGQQAQAISASPVLLDTITVTASGASIGATDLSGGALSEGLYELRFYARIVQAATVSSSLTVTLDFVDKGVVVSRSFPALTANTIATALTDPPLTIRSDGASPIRYSTTYASVGATPMLYDLEIVLTRVQA